MDEPRPPVHVMSPELSLKLAQLRIFLRLAEPRFIEFLLDNED